MSAAPIDDAQGEAYLRLCNQVGHLFLSFANLEGVLSTVLKLHMAETISADESNPSGIMLAAAVYGSMRFKDSRDTIKRVAATEDHDKDKLAFLATIFEQAGHIQAFRDMLAHQSLQRATERFDGTWRLSNLFTTKDATKPMVYEFTTEAVNAASGDLVKAASLLGRQRVTSKLIETLVPDIAPIPWRYKPSMLKLVPRNKLSFPQEPPHQPEASEA